jgi:phage recombination protein Bet
MAAVRQAKKRKKAMSELTAYVPDDVTNKEQYVQLINQQVLGKDKNGAARPMADLIYFLQVCRTTGLNPFSKQIYAVYRWDSRAGKEVMAIQAGIDGLRAIAERTGIYAGSDAGTFDYPSDPNSQYPIRATVTVYKLNKITGERMPTTATAQWAEYYPGEKLGAMWHKLPETMLEKVAESKALRKAFPNVAEVYTAEEMQQADALPGGITLTGIEAEIAAAKTPKEISAIVQKLPVADRKAIIGAVNARLGEL